MKFNIQSTLFASLLLLGTATAAPVGVKVGDIDVGRHHHQENSRANDQVAKRQGGIVADAYGNSVGYNTPTPTTTPLAAGPVVNTGYRRL